MCGPRADSYTTLWKICWDAVCKVDTCFFLTPRPPGQSFCSSGPSQEIGSTEQFDPNILLIRTIPLIRVQPGPWERDREQPATRPNGRFDGGCTWTYSSSCGSLTETLAVVIPNSPPTSDLHAWRLFAPLWSFSVFVELLSGFSPHDSVTTERGH